MTDSSPTTPPGESETIGLAGVVEQILGAIENQRLGSGDLAELRRLRPDDPGGAAFWRLIVGTVEPAGQLFGNDAEARWALVLQAIGNLHGLHQRGRRLGQALAAANVSEMRLVRLLRADLDDLGPQLRAVVHQLASGGQAVDLSGIAYLVVTARRSGSTGPKNEHETRRIIARDYYYGLHKAAEATKTSAAV